MADFYPKGMDARAAWHQNFADNITLLQLKYNLTAAQVAQAAADNTWMQFWVAMRHTLEARNQQVTKYFNDIAGNDPTLDPPAIIDFVVADGPTEVPPGIEFRTRELARHIKGHSAYAEADGEMLGIVSAESEPANLGEMTAAFTVKSMPNFGVEAKFKKNGADAMRFEFRRKGGQWMHAGYLIASPGTITIAPTEAGTAEQIEMRGIMVQKNQDVGGFSDHVPAFIAP
jgi:hypothetical protein